MTSTPPDLRPDAVVVAWMFPSHTSGWFTYDLARMIRFDAQGPGHICGPDGGLLSLSSGPRIAEARNTIVDQFADMYPKADWLLMLDSDMTFDPDLVERMLGVADPKNVPILGGLCFCAGGDDRGPYPTLYREIETKQNYVHVAPVEDYPRNALVKVGATGGACLLVHRQVFAAMKQPWPNGFGTTQDGELNPHPWFSEGLVGPGGKQLGEDIAFCRRAVLLGIPVHVHTGIKLGHVKTQQINEDYYAEWRRKNPPPPQLNRAQRRAATRQKATVA
jgi:hypothetical protein